MKLTTSLNGQALGRQGLLAPPWTRVRRVQLIRREVREYLPGSAIELLLSEGDTVVEGGADLGGGAALADAAAQTVYATLMVTADLATLGNRFRDPADAATAERVVELLSDHPELPERIAGRMRPELARLCGDRDVSDWSVTVEPSVRAEGTAVYIDADIVAVPPRTEVG